MEFVASITFVGNVTIVALLIVFLLSKQLPMRFLAVPIAIIQAYGLYLAFAVALFSTIGSLYFSEVLYLPPCDLCWYQRALMYPQTIILFIAAVKRDVTALSTLGIVIGVYNYLLQVFPDMAASCGIDSVSCSTVSGYYFGYITIPVMSITGFVFILFFALMASNKKLPKEVTNHGFK